MPFQLEISGLTAVRPVNWKFDVGTSGFTSSSSLDAPDQFSGVFISRAEAEKMAASLHVPAECACQAVSATLLNQLKQNTVEGPKPETLEQVTHDDGSRTLVVATTTVTRTSRIPVCLITYARTTITSDGLIFAHAAAPAGQFAAEEERIREMVDSVAFPEDSTA